MAFPADRALAAGATCGTEGITEGSAINEEQTHNNQSEPKNKGVHRCDDENRREFLKNAGVATAAAVGASTLSAPYVKAQSKIKWRCRPMPARRWPSM